MFGQDTPKPLSEGDKLLVSRYRKGVAVLLEARVDYDGSSVVFRQNVRGEPILWCRIESSSAVCMLENPDTFYAAYSKTWGEYIKEDWLRYAYEAAKKKHPTWEWDFGACVQHVESLGFQYTPDDDDVIVRLEEYIESRTPDHDYYVVLKALLETYGSRMKKMTCGSATWYEIE